MKIKGFWINYHSGNCPLPLGTFVSALAAGMDGRVWLNVVRTESYLEDGFEVTEGKSEGILVFYQEQWTFHSLKDLGILNAADLKIACDGKGYLWMYAAPRFLYRFDGQKIDLYLAGEKGLPSDLGLVCVFTVDTEDNFWMVTVPGGIYQFNEQNWRKLLPENISSYDKWITYACADQIGRIWCAVQDENVTNFVLYENNQWKEHASIPIGRDNEVVQAMAADQKGSLWVGWASLAGSDKHGLWRLEHKGATWQQYTVNNSPLVDNHIKSITLDHSGHIWVGTTGGFVVFDEGKPMRWEVIIPGILHGPLTEEQAKGELKRNNNLKPIHISDYATVDANGHVWVRTHNGVGKFSEP